MRWFWPILPVVLSGLFLALACYLLFAPGPWRISYSVRLLVGGVLLLYAGVRSFFAYRRWRKERTKGITE